MLNFALCFRSASTRTSLRKSTMKSDLIPQNRHTCCLNGRHSSRVINSDAKEVICRFIWGVVREHRFYSPMLTLKSQNRQKKAPNEIPSTPLAIPIFHSAIFKYSVWKQRHIKNIVNQMCSFLNRKPRNLTIKNVLILVDVFRVFAHLPWWQVDDLS